MTAEGAPLSNEALNAIHWAHRIGALLTFVTPLVMLNFATRSPFPFGR